MAHATVKWFDPERGFGFLARDGDAGDLFFHATEIVATDTLRAGEKVTYRLDADRRGRPCARHVAPAQERK